MPKSLSLLFAGVSVIFMSATAVSLSHNRWLALLFFALTILNIGYGFVVKARYRRKQEPQQ
ncbi:DUF5325 family protein [Paenibacillus sp. GCM10012307]|uniref:DUF5325 family protein n=1 Tax=Paenibacillus roseus TaxID=2798579 RepID=A0A934IZX7_9BACL|nr:DUF5325 family protein [Paenibacillus roseus]MBJ6362311.1 DUF5325 family protein [Paenibacillus roseus]